MLTGCSSGDQTRTDVRQLADKSPAISGQDCLYDPSDKLSSFSRFELFFPLAGLRLCMEGFGMDNGPGSETDSPPFFAQFVVRPEPFLQIGSITDIYFIVLLRIKDVNRKHKKGMEQKSRSTKVDRL